MNHFAEGTGKFEVLANTVKSESGRNTNSDPNSSTVKSETQRSASSDPNSLSLPCSLYECKCKVVVVQDLLQCGVIELEGENKKAYCLFFGKDFLRRNEQDLKLSTQVPVGSKLLANARLMKERSIIPFLATSVWEDGAILGEYELSKLYSHLDSQEIEQYNRLSLDLQWFLPIDDSVNNNFDKDEAAHNKLESNKNSQRNYKDLSGNRSPGYRQSQKRRGSPGPDSQTGSMSSSRHRRERGSSRSPIYHRSQTRGKRSRSRSRHHRSRSRSPTYHCSQTRGKRFRSRSSRAIRHRSRSRSPTHHHSQTRSRSPRDKSGTTLRYLHGQEQASTERSTYKIKEKQDLIGSMLTEDGGNQEETKITTIKDIARKVLIKKEADIPQSTIQTHQPVDKRSISNSKGKILRILNSNYGIAIVLGFGRLCRVLFDIFDVWIDNQVCAELGKTLNDVMQEGDLVSLHAIYIENPLSSSTNQQIEYMATAVVKANNIEVLLSTKLPVPPSPMEVSQDKIENFHKVSKVVLDMQEDGSSFKKVMVKSMKQDEIPTECGILFKWKENVQHVQFFCFHCKQEHFKSKHGLKRVGVGRLQHPMLSRAIGQRATPFWSNGTVEPWEAHDQHVQTCQDSKCIELGKLRFEKIKNAITSNNQSQKKLILQDKEFQRLKLRGSAGKTVSNNLYCFHCQYKGESMGHFASKEHQDHIRDCGIKILDCPENPELSSAVAELVKRREMLYLPRELMSSSYHRYFCLHCQEPFSDKHHIQGANHTLHMAKKSCNRTCKTGGDLPDDEKCLNGAKWCFICNVKLWSKTSYQAHVKNSKHTGKVNNLFKK